MLLTPTLPRLLWRPARQQVLLPEAPPRLQRERRLPLREQQQPVRRAQHEERREQRSLGSTAPRDPT